MTERCGGPSEATEPSGSGTGPAGFRQCIAYTLADFAEAKRSCGSCPVREFAACSTLDDGGIRDLNAIKSRRRLAPHKTLFIEGEKALYAYVVVSGALKLLKSLGDGRTQITGLLMPGDFLGLPPRGVYATSAEALPGTELCQLPRRSLESIFARFPHLEMRVLSDMYDDWAAAQDHMLLLGRKSAKERVCTFILDLAHRAERRSGPVKQVDIPLQRGEIADYLGLTLFTVSRTFRELHRDGVIDLVKPDLIAIDDLRTLEAIAAGD